MDTSALTDILGSVVHACSLKYTTIYGYANNLLRIFIVIELAIFGIYMAFEGGDIIQSLFKKVLLIGVFQFLVLQYAWLVDALLQSFVGIGLATGSGSTLTLSQFLDPSELIRHGFEMVYPILARYERIGVVTAIFGGLFNLMTILSVFMILIGFVLMGLQVFMAIVEFYIVTTLAVILIPFGLFRPTAFLADRAFGSIFAVSVKLMVLAFAASIALPVVQGLAFSGDDATMRETFSMVIGVFAIVMVMWRAPMIAAGMMSGSSNLDAGSGIIQPMLTSLGSVSMLRGYLPRFNGGQAVSASPSSAVNTAKAASMAGDSGNMTQNASVAQASSTSEKNT